MWFEVPEHLRDSWADVTHGGRYVGKLMKNNFVCDINNISNIFVVCICRYKEWKNELRTHWTKHGNARSGTPTEFQYREYEWRWLLTSEFNNPRKQVFK